MIYKKSTCNIVQYIVYHDVAGLSKGYIYIDYMRNNFEKYKIISYLCKMINIVDFKIEGWFPPGIVKSPITGIKYACCGSNWIEISNDMTMEEVMKGWICTAPAIIPKEAKKVTKRLTKKQLSESFDIMITNKPLKKLLKSI